MFKTYVITEEIDPLVVEDILSGYSQVEVVPSPSEDDIIKNCKDADAIISLYEPITKKVMDSLPNLKYVSLCSIGFNTVDVKYAKEKNIHVSNNPNYCVEEVADHAAALILTLSRKIVEYNNSVRLDREWKYDVVGNSINRLASRTLGLVGFGSISKKLAQRMQSFGCTVIASDPFVSEEAGKEYNVQMVDLEEILEKSDIISAHVPLNKSTEGMFDNEAFKKMKKKPIFINCARGGLVDEKDLLEALDKGLISAAGLDVLSSEYPDLNSCELIDRENVIITPHAAFYSQEAMKEADVFTAEHVKFFIQQDLKKIPMIV